MFNLCRVTPGLGGGVVRSGPAHNDPGGHSQGGRLGHSQLGLEVRHVLAGTGQTHRPGCLGVGCGPSRPSYEGKRML